MHEALGIGGDCEVTGDREGFGALLLDFFRGLEKRLFAACGEGEATAFVCENEGRRSADAAGGAAMMATLPARPKSMATL